MVDKIAKGCHVVRVPLYIGEEHGTITGRCQLLNTVTLFDHCWHDSICIIAIKAMQISGLDTTRFHSATSFDRRLGRILACKTLLGTA